MKTIAFFLSFHVLVCIVSQAQNWIELGGVNTLAAYGGPEGICTDAAGNIYTGGAFQNSSGNRYVAKFDGNSWSELGGLDGLGAQSSIQTLCSDAADNIYAAGNFSNSSGKRYVAKFDGTGWTELGGLNGLSAGSVIYSICTDASGNIYAAGNFRTSSGKPYVAKFDGNTWTALGGPNGYSSSGLYSDEIRSVCADAAGNIYAAGYSYNFNSHYYVAKYDGSSWTEVGGLSGLAANAPILSLCTDNSGNIYAAGSFTNTSGKEYVAKFDGNTWSELGGLNGLAANDYIYSICSDPVGNVYAAGLFALGASNPGPAHRYVAKYDGNTWSELGDLNAITPSNFGISCVFSDAYGDMYATGYFTNSFVNSFVAKYDMLSIGCTAPEACNYDSAAASDDGSCYFTGDPCDDGDSSTSDDVYNANCECAGLTAIEELQTEISLYPNPAEHDVTVTINNSVPDEVTIIDAMGHPVIQVKRCSRIDIHTLASGLYTLQASHKNIQVERQLIKR